MPETEAIVLLAGGEAGAYFQYNQQEEYKSMILSVYPVSEKGNIDTIDINHSSTIIEFSISKEGYFNIGLHIEGECPIITSNHIMPGDNIKTFLNSYEDGLYEKLVSLSDPTEEYCIGPYYFQFEKDPEYAGGFITIGKRDENSILPVMIRFEDEYVTAIYRMYRGQISGFEDKPSLR